MFMFTSVQKYKYSILRIESSTVEISNGKYEEKKNISLVQNSKVLATFSDYSVSKLSFEKVHVISTHIISIIMYTTTLHMKYI